MLCAQYFLHLTTKRSTCSCWPPALLMQAKKGPQLGEIKGLMKQGHYVQPASFFFTLLFWCWFHKTGFIQMLCCWLQMLGMSWGCLDSNIPFMKVSGKWSDWTKVFREDSSMGWHVNGWYLHLKNKLCQFNMFWAV